VCFDTNHLLGEKIEEFIKNVGNKIATVHISDYDFKNERHWLPGEGDINWTSLMTELNNIGYDGPLMHELGLKNPPTIIRPREIMIEDIVNSAKSLDKCIAPTHFGKRVDGLKYWYER
jgi:sugar phosphate isomerase/epimerase